MEEITKKCTKCGIEKPLSDFYKNKNSCKKCLLDYRRIKHREKLDCEYRNCVICGKLFFRFRKDTKYCSVGCRKKASSIRCKNHISDHQKQYRINNSERIKVIKKNYSVNNREKYREWNIKYVKNNYNKISIYRKQIKKSNSVNLTDSYIKDQICNRNILKYKDIPKEMIEIKRIQIQISRLIKENS